MLFRRGTKVVDVLRALNSRHVHARIQDEDGYEVTASHSNLKAGQYLVLLPSSGSHVQLLHQMSSSASCQMRMLSAVHV